MRRSLCCILALSAVSLASAKALIQIKEEMIAEIPVKVISEYRSPSQTRFVEIVIAEEIYSRENLIRIWRHYCEKYDKKDRLDLRVYLNRTYEYNRQLDGWPVNMHTGEAFGPNGIKVKIRSFEAYFERKGEGVLAYGGDNELMIYSPNPNEPEKKESVVLAGKGYKK